MRRETTARAKAFAHARARGCTSFALSLPLLASWLHLAGCGGKAQDAGAKYPPRPEGCDVTMFQEAPTVPTDNIGPVSARCGVDIADDECERTLKDQVCKLGGDVLWGVAEPRLEGDKKYWSGRAAHTK
jgi:hypothetical protein